MQREYNKTRTRMKPGASKSARILLFYFSGVTSQYYQVTWYVSVIFAQQQVCITVYYGVVLQFSATKYQNC